MNILGQYPTNNEIRALIKGIDSDGKPLWVKLAPFHVWSTDTIRVCMYRYMYTYTMHLGIMFYMYKLWAVRDKVLLPGVE